MKKSIKKINIILSIFALLIIFTSCATTISTRIQRPAELDLSYAESISIFPFAEKPGFWDYMFFGRETYDLANYFTNQLETNLIAANYFTITNAKQSQAFIDIGILPATDIFITGKVYNVYSKIKEKEVKNSKNSEETHTEYYRVLNYSVIYQIVDGKTRQILDEFDQSYSEESGLFLTEEEVSSIDDLAQSELSSLAVSIRKKISPYTERKSINLLKDKTKNPQMKYANELAKKGSYTNAYKEFLEVYETTGMFEAGYNAAMLLVVLEKYDDAKILMTELYSQTGSQKARNALKDIQYEIKSREKYLQQQQSREKALNQASENP